jgi:hypothetical protein
VLIYFVFNSSFLCALLGSVAVVIKPSLCCVLDVICFLYFRFIFVNLQIYFEVMIIFLHNMIYMCNFLKSLASVCTKYQRDIVN